MTAVRTIRTVRDLVLWYVVSELRDCVASGDRSKWCAAHDSRWTRSILSCNRRISLEQRAVETVDLVLPMISAAIATRIEALVQGDDMLGGLLRHASNTTARTAIEAAAQVARGGAR